MIPFNPVATAISVSLVAVGLCLVFGLLRLIDLLTGAGLMVGVSAGLAGDYGAPVLMDRKPPTKR